MDRVSAPSPVVRFYQEGLAKRVTVTAQDIMATERVWCILNGIVDVYFRVETTVKP